MKVYILMGDDPKPTFLSIVYSATLYKNLKEKIMEDFRHDYPYLKFFWIDTDLIEENEKLLNI